MVSEPNVPVDLNDELEGYLMREHTFEWIEDQVMDTLCIKWKSKQDVPYEVRFGRFGMTYIVHACTLLDDHQGSFIRIAAIMNKRLWAEEDETRVFSVQACAYIYLLALRERQREQKTGQKCNLTVKEDWESADPQKAKHNIQTTIDEAWGH